MTDLTRMLRPRSIAVVGGAEAAMVIRQCQLMDYDGEIWPVHPKKSEVEGLMAYHCIEALPAVPDATFIGVNRHLTLGIVESLAKIGAGGAVCYASGFLEADEEGADLQAELLKRAGTMPVLGPNCYGVINYADGALLWPDQHGGKRLIGDETGVAIITQSSNIAINLTMQRRGLPIAYMLTAGNQAMIGVSDLAITVLDDPRVTSLGLHIEGFDSISGMEALAKKSRQLNKPIVALKVGRSEQARQATISHTASLAGAHAASQAFLKRLGIGQVKTLAALLETLKFLHIHGTLAGYRIGSMSCSGGEASLVADSAQSRKIHFPELSDDEKQRIQQALGPMVTVNNPLDYHTYIWGDQQKMQQAYSAMMAADHDLTILILDFPSEKRCATDDWEVALYAFEEAVKETGANAVLTASLSDNIPETVVAELMQKGIVAIGGMNVTLIAVEVAADIGEAWKRAVPVAVMQTQRIANASQQSTSGQADRIASKDSGNHADMTNHAVRSASSITLDEATAKSQLAAVGVSVPWGRRVESFEEALQYVSSCASPVVLKALGIAHKTELNAVRLNVENESQLAEAYADLSQLSESLYLEAMIGQAVAELIIGITRDVQFGLVMTIGAGGTLVEVLKDSVTLLLPATEEDITAALCNLKTAALLKGYRGKPAADIPAAINTILAIQRYALNHSDDLLELDVNPLILCATGQGAYAADALIVLNQGGRYV